MESIPEIDASPTVDSEDKHKHVCLKEQKEQHNLDRSQTHPKQLVQSEEDEGSLSGYGWSHDPGEVLQYSNIPEGTTLPNVASTEDRHTPVNTSGEHACRISSEPSLNLESLLVQEISDNSTLPTQNADRQPPVISEDAGTVTNTYGYNTERISRKQWKAINIFVLDVEQKIIASNKWLQFSEAIGYDMSVERKKIGSEPKQFYKLLNEWITVMKETERNPIPYLKWALEEVDEEDLVTKLTQKFGSTHDIRDEDMDQLQTQLTSRDFSITVKPYTNEGQTIIQAATVVMGDRNVVTKVDGETKTANGCDRQLTEPDSKENQSQDFAILETDIEESDSTGQQLSIKFGQTTPAVLKSSSFSELEGSISQEKKIEKDWFYKLNVTCDNYSLHLITDFNIQQKYSDLSEAIQCQGHQKLIIERRTCDKATTAFEKMYMHMISSKPLSISECIKQNFDLAVRFLLARNIAPDELCKHLHESMTENRNNISKAIGWSITKQFYKGMKTSDILNRVIDIWPGFRCRCARHCTKSHSRICSSEAVIIVEVDQLSNTIQGDFYGIPIEQSIQVPDNEPTQVQFKKEKTDLCSSSYSEIQMITSVPGTIAEKCFQQHSKLTMIYIHPFKRTTIQLCCQINGVIPMGEPHFPKTLNGIDTCIAEGNVRFIAKIKIGDNIGLSSPSGTLGGFVKMHGFNALLTCAHVVYDKETLIAGNKSERHKSKTKVLCFDKCNSDVKVESGYVFNEAFDCNNGNETSVDAAVVILDEEKVTIDQNDILNDESHIAKSVIFLGMKDCYLNSNYVTPKSTRGTMKARYVGLTSGYSESDITFEDYDKDDDNFTEKPHGLSLYFEDLQSHLQNIESECPKPPDIPFEVHFQQLIVPKLDENLRSGRHYFRFYNQLLFENILFEPGDSGTCIYVVEDKTVVRPDNKPNPTGCLAMAIASFYDKTENRNKCIGTPMKAILKKLGFI